MCGQEGGVLSDGGGVVGGDGVGGVCVVGCVGGGSCGFGEINGALPLGCFYENVVSDAAFPFSSQEGNTAGGGGSVVGCVGEADQMYLVFKLGFQIHTRTVYPGSLPISVLHR